MPSALSTGARIRDLMEEEIATGIVRPGTRLDEIKLAERFGVTPWAIDKWARRARDQGLIPQATTGRGNKRRQQDGAADVDSE